MTFPIASSVIDNDADAAERSAGVASMIGRPSLYTAAIAQRILDQLSDGRRLDDICGDPGMPCSGTVWKGPWANERRGSACLPPAAGQSHMEKQRLPHRSLPPLLRLGGEKRSHTLQMR
jgi:hypothetical protein